MALNASSHGIGLSFCHKICKGLNGDLVVESKQGFGSKFSFTFFAELLKIEPKKMNLEI